MIARMTLYSIRPSFYLSCIFYLLLNKGSVKETERSG